MPIKILLADDSAMARNMIRCVLATRPDFEICSEAIDGIDAIEKSKTACPDLAILDVSMPRMNGIEAAREILKYCPNAIVVTDSMHSIEPLLSELKKAGIKAFVPKSDLATALIPTIEAVLRGQDLIQNRVAPRA